MNGPYDASGDVGHPGVQGEPYQPQMPGVNVGVKVDNPGTGTFPPHQQGAVGRAQPAGLSAKTQYGEPTPSGDNQMASPVTHPVPDSAEGPQAAGLKPGNEINDPDQTSDEGDEGDEG